MQGTALVNKFASRKQAVWPHLRKFLQVQQRIVFVGVLICALFAAINPNTYLLFMGVCVLVIGNLMYVLQFLSSRIYLNRPFPWNWLLYLPAMTATSLIASLGAVGLLRWMHPEAGAYWALFHASWKIAMVVCMGAGIATHAVLEIQGKLQEKNKLLELAVERGKLALHQQEQEMNRALEIQKELLPKEMPRLDGIEFSGAWRPARAVGGDYFDFLRLDDHRLGICIGDVSGKGLTAALLMANLQAAFRAYAMPEATPSAVCAKLNAFICGNVAPGKFITFFYGIFDAQRHTLTYENAGHCPGLLLRSGGQMEFLSGQGGVLGVLPEWRYADFTVELAPGDRLLFYTDGVSEAQNKDAEEFGYQRIAAAAGPTPSSAADCQRRVVEEVTKFCAGEFGDDVTLIAAAVR